VATPVGGHEQYRAWLVAVGAWPSPLSPSPVLHTFGAWTSLTVEGLHQGLKIWSVEDRALVDPALEPRWLGSGEVHFPNIMKIGPGLIGSLLFRVLKSGGARRDGKRNRHLGRLPDGARNWAFDGRWLHPVRAVRVS